MFIVPTADAGFAVQRITRFFGNIGGDEAELTFDDLRVEPWQLVGELDEGFATALYGVWQDIQLCPGGWLRALGAGAGLRQNQRCLWQPDRGFSRRHVSVG
jgi:hypothetical protein